MVQGNSIRELYGHSTVSDSGVLTAKYFEGGKTIGEVLGFTHLFARVIAEYSTMTCPRCNAEIPANAELNDPTRFEKLFAGRKIALLDSRESEVIDRITFTSIYDERFQEALRVGRKYDLPWGIASPLEKNDPDDSIRVLFRRCCPLCGYEPEKIDTPQLEKILKEGRSIAPPLSGITLDGKTLDELCNITINDCVESLLRYGSSEKLSESLELLQKAQCAKYPIGRKLSTLFPEDREHLTLIVGILSEVSGKTFFFPDLLWRADRKSLNAVGEDLRRLAQSNNTVISFQYLFNSLHHGVKNAGSLKDVLEKSTAGVCIIQLENINEFENIESILKRFAVRAVRVVRRSTEGGGTVAGFLGILPILLDRFATLPEALMQGISKKDLKRSDHSSAVRIRYKGYSLQEAMRLSVLEFAEVFSNIPKLRKICMFLKNPLFASVLLSSSASDLKHYEWNLLRVASALSVVQENELVLIEELGAGLAGGDIEDALVPILQVLQTFNTRVILAESNPLHLHLDSVQCVTVTTPERQGLS